MQPDLRSVGLREPRLSPKQLKRSRSMFIGVDYAAMEPRNTTYIVVVYHPEDSKGNRTRLKTMRAVKGVDLERVARRLASHYKVPRENVDVKDRDASGASGAGTDTAAVRADEHRTAVLARDSGAAST